MRMTGAFVVSGILAAAVVRAETESAVATSAVPPMDVTGAVSRGVEFFRAEAARDDAGWLFWPLEGKRVIGWKTNQVAFKEITVTVPDYEYETYEVLVPGGSPGEPMRRETRRRIKGIRGERQEKRVVPAKDGTIYRQMVLPIYEKTAGARWRFGGLGNNGLALVALRRCGVPADDPLVAQPAENLAQLIETFGWPDITHDVAWLTAAFALLPGDGYAALAERGASKLLDAQIVTGPATGLWGPVAVNSEMLAAYLKQVLALSQEQQTLQARRKAASGAKAKSLEEQLTALEARQEQWQTQMQRVSQLGGRLFESLGARGKSRVVLEHMAERLDIEGLPYLMYNQTTPIWSPPRWRCLPCASRTNRDDYRPPVGDRTRPGSIATTFPPPRVARDVVQRAARAVTAARTGDGQWSEWNLQQPVTDFAWLQSIPPARADTFTALPSPVTLASTAAGAGALASSEWLLTGRVGRGALEHETVRAGLRAFWGLRAAEQHKEARVFYEALPHLAMPRHRRGQALRTDFTEWNPVADWLARQQSASGAWGRDKQNHLVPSTSVRARLDVLPDITTRNIYEFHERPHLAPGYFEKQTRLARYGAPERSLFTAWALLFLADGLPHGWSPPANELPAQATTP